MCLVFINLAQPPQRGNIFKVFSYFPEIVWGLERQVSGGQQMRLIKKRRKDVLKIANTLRGC